MAATAEIRDRLAVLLLSGILMAAWLVYLPILFIMEPIVLRPAR